MTQVAEFGVAKLRLAPRTPSPRNRAPARPRCSDSRWSQGAAALAGIHVPQKAVPRASNVYANAPMPFMER